MCAPGRPLSGFRALSKNLILLPSVQGGSLFGFPSPHPTFNYSIEVVEKYVNTKMEKIIIAKTFSYRYIVERWFAFMEKYLSYSMECRWKK